VFTLEADIQIEWPHWSPASSLRRRRLLVCMPVRWATPCGAFANYALFKLPWNTRAANVRSPARWVLHRKSDNFGRFYHYIVLL
jgi:hypothetical protein